MRRIQQFLDIREVPLECLVAQDEELARDQVAVRINKKSFSWGVKRKDAKTSEAPAKSKRQKKNSKARSKKRTRSRSRNKMHRVETETTLDMSMYQFTNGVFDTVVEVAPDEEQGAEEEQRIPQTLDGVITLKEIEFEAKQGEFVCVIGDVGSGKSSLLSALNGDMLYASKRLIKKYAGTEGLVFSGLQSQLLSTNDLGKLQERLVSESIQASAVPPVSLNGSISLVQQSPWI